MMHRTVWTRLPFTHIPIFAYLLNYSRKATILESRRFHPQVDGSGKKKKVSQKKRQRIERKEKKTHEGKNVRGEIGERRAGNQKG